MMLRNTTRLIVLDNGRIRLRKEDLVDETDAVKVNLETQVVAPVYAVLISHPDGLVLFDAGCHPNAMGLNGRWSAKLQSESPWIATKQDMLLTRLLEHGIRPNEIRYVICSHLHCDHAGNLEYFPDSEIIVHADEWAAAMREYQAHVTDGEFVYDDISAWVKRKLHFRLVPSTMSSLTLFPELTIHNLGRGHSHGMLAVEVQSSEHGISLLASDAAFAAPFYGEKAIAPRLSLDADGYLNGIRVLEQLAYTRDANVWFGHDLRQFCILKG